MLSRDEPELREDFGHIADGSRCHSASRAGYSLSICIGGSAFDPAANKGSEALIMRLDELMYEEKRKKG